MNRIHAHPLLVRAAGIVALVLAAAAPRARANDWSDGIQAQAESDQTLADTRNGEEPSVVVYEIETASDAPATASSFRGGPDESPALAGLELSAGSTTAIGYYYNLRPWLKGSISAGGQWFANRNFRQNPDNFLPRDIPRALGSLQASVRAVLWGGRLEAGVAAYAPIGDKWDQLEDGYRDGHRRIGPQVQINLLQFSNHEFVGNKLFLVVTGYRKDFVPSDFSVKYVLNFRDWLPRKEAP